MEPSDMLNIIKYGKDLKTNKLENNKLGIKEPVRINDFGTVQ